MSNKIPKDWNGPMKACAAILREHGVKTAWNSTLVRGLMMWGIKHLLFFKAHHEERKQPADTYIVTDGCMWEMNRQNGTEHAHAIEVVNERTGAVRYIVSGSRIKFERGDISDIRSQASYNARHAPKNA